MNYRQYIVEIGSGIDLHGEDETKAAQRAVRDAIGHASMIGLGKLFKVENFKDIDEGLLVDVTIATPNPEKVDGDAVLKTLPEGHRRITIIKGGLRFPTPETPEEARTHGIIVSNAVIVVLVDIDRLRRL